MNWLIFQGLVTLRWRPTWACLWVPGTDDAVEVRIIRLQNHPFFLVTLFQPQRSSLKGFVHPLIREFLSASLAAYAMK